MSQKAHPTHLSHAIDHFPGGADRVGMILFIGTCSKNEEETHGKGKRTSVLPAPRSESQKVGQLTGNVR